MVKILTCKVSKVVADGRSFYFFCKDYSYPCNGHTNRRNNLGSFDINVITSLWKMVLTEKIIFVFSQALLAGQRYTERVVLNKILAFKSTQLPRKSSAIWAADMFEKEQNCLSHMERWCKSFFTIAAKVPHVKDFSIQSFKITVSERVLWELCFWDPLAFPYHTSTSSSSSSFFFSSSL